MGVTALFLGFLVEAIFVAIFSIPFAVWIVSYHSLMPLLFSFYLLRNVAVNVVRAHREQK